MLCVCVRMCMCADLGSSSVLVISGLQFLADEDKLSLTLRFLSFSFSPISVISFPFFALSCWFSSFFLFLSPSPSPLLSFPLISPSCPARPIRAFLPFVLHCHPLVFLPFFAPVVFSHLFCVVIYLSCFRYTAFDICTSLFSTPCLFFFLYFFCFYLPFLPVVVANFVSHSSLSFYTLSHFLSFYPLSSYHKPFFSFFLSVWLLSSSISISQLHPLHIFPIILSLFFQFMSLSTSSYPFCFPLSSSPPHSLGFCLSLCLCHFSLILFSQNLLSAISYLCLFHCLPPFSLSVVFFPCCVLMQNGMFYTSYVSTYSCLVRLNELLNNSSYVLAASLSLFLLLISFYVTSCFFVFLRHLSKKN